MNFISQAIAKPASKIRQEDILNYIKNNGISFAVVHLLLAGLTIAAESGFGNDNSLEIAEKLHTTEEEIMISAKGGIPQKAGKKLPLLPQSCREAAEELEKVRVFYEKGGIFPPELIDSIISELKAHEDEDILRHPAENREKVKQLIEKYIYYSPFSF